MNKRNKRLLICIFCAVLVVTLPIIVDLFYYSDFSVHEYLKTTESTAVDNYYIYGNTEQAVVTSKTEARNAAKIVWKERYELTEKHLHTEVAFDKENACWLVTGMSLQDYCLQFNYCYGVCGGVYNAIISENGKVLACWVEV